MQLIKREITYSFNEFSQMRRLNKKERKMFDLCKQLDLMRIDLRKNEKLFKTLALTLAAAFMINGAAFGKPATGYTQLDNGAWKIVEAFQAVIFWVSLLYSLRELLVILFKRTGEVKDVLVGLIICAMSYLAPVVWGAIPKLFK
jgi:hypothetical protein